jgi:ornithine--oxo-acid transaminase
MATSPLTHNTQSDYSEHVNPQWVRLLDLLQMNVSYQRCEGAELTTTAGTRVLDFLSGYCVHNTGHNHKRIVRALQQELGRCGPAMLQSHVPELAGLLAARLCASAGGGLEKVFFCSSGSEGVEAAIKFSRARTRRQGLLYARGAFHGLTCGAISLMDDPFWTKNFGAMLPDTQAVPFGALEALETQLATRKYAAFIVEPIQSEAGVKLPHAVYLNTARTLCHRYGTLLVLDEVQTGMYRTGRFLCAHHYNVQPDMVVLAKALSGGLIPIGAVLMTEEIYHSVYDSLQRAIVHTSTFSENGLAMRAGLATLDVLEEERLGQRAEQSGKYLRGRLEQELSGFEMVKQVRGLGLLCGVEFQPPKRVKLRLAFEAFRQIHEGLFGQMLVMRMFRQGVLTQICGNNFMVLKVAPPLVANEEQMETFVSALKSVLEAVHSSEAFWQEALGLARRALRI